MNPILSEKIEQDIPKLLYKELTDADSQALQLKTLSIGDQSLQIRQFLGTLKKESIEEKAQNNIKSIEKPAGVESDAAKQVRIFQEAIKNATIELFNNS